MYLIYSALKHIKTISKICVELEKSPFSLLQNNLNCQAEYILLKLMSVSKISMSVTSNTNVQILNFALKNRKHDT